MAKNPTPPKNPDRNKKPKMPEPHTALWAEANENLRKVTEQARAYLARKKQRDEEE